MIRLRQRGSSLVEVLVAVLIMSTGLLGMVALQSRVLRAGVTNIQRTQAIMLGQYLMELMRADRVVALQGGYGSASAGWRCSVTLITGTQLANENLRSALTSAKSLLGQPHDTTTCIRTDCAATGVCEVSLQWADSTSPSAAPQIQSVRARL